MKVPLPANFAVATLIWPKIKQVSTFNWAYRQLQSMVSVQQMFEVQESLIEGVI